MKDTFDIEAGIEALHDSSLNAGLHLFVSSLNSNSMINNERSEIWRDKAEWALSCCQVKSTYPSCNFNQG